MERNIIIKVDQVTEIKEAEHLDSLGVDYISISCPLSPTRMSSCPSLDKTDTERNILQIRSCLRNSKLVGEIPTGLASVDISLRDVLDCVKRFDLSAVQFSQPYVPPLVLREALSNINVPIIYSGIKVSYDDDPSWILSSYKYMNDFNLDFFDIQVFPTVPDAWNFLKNESPKFPEEIQIDDLDELAEKHSTLLSLNFSPSNFKAIMKTFSHVRGYSFMLKNSKSKHADAHFFTLNELTQIICQRE